MFTRRNLFASLLALPLAAAFATAAGKMTFEVYADAKGEFRWRLLDGDKNVANAGQGYARKADCTTMVDNFKADISKYTFEVYEDNAKETRFRLKARNGNVVGSSTGSFKTKADAEKAIDEIKKGVKDAVVKDVEKK